MTETKTRAALMTRAVITGPKQIRMEQLDVPTPDPTQVLVRVRAAALCTWEQRTFAGIDTFSYPLVGGHENSGIVAAVGKDVELKVKVGDQVALAGLKRCGQCYSCRSGIDNLCDNARSKRVPDVPWGPGGFGDYVLAEGYQVYPVGPVATPLEAALTEPTSCVLHDMKRHPVRNGDVVVIVGAGIMGLLHLVIARQTPSFIIVSEPEAPRRQKARELGADAVIDPSTEDYAVRVNELSQGRGANVTYMSIGIPKAIEAAVSAAAKRGVVSIYAS
ncbi:MAG TPA: alcohol dehydrogenase catalytic domain-containing protein, partial [Candidatus Limnocylindria bacterium]